MVWGCLAKLTSRELENRFERKEVSDILKTIHVIVAFVIKP